MCAKGVSYSMQPVVESTNQISMYIKVTRADQMRHALWLIVMQAKCGQQMSLLHLLGNSGVVRCCMLAMAWFLIYCGLPGTSRDLGLLLLRGGPRAHWVRKSPFASLLPQRWPYFPSSTTHIHWSVRLWKIFYLVNIETVWWYRVKM
jgi:hypothetical protein